MISIIGQLLINVLVAGSNIALVAVSFGIIYSTARFFHFAHGAVYTIGAYTAYMLVTIIRVPPLLGIVGGIVVTALLGGLMTCCIYSPLWRGGASSLILLLTSLGLLVVLQNILSLFFGDQTYILWHGAVEEGLSFIGAKITPIQLATVFVSLSVLGSAWLVLKFFRYGIILRAVANEPELSQVVGVASKKVILEAFIGSSALAGLAGILAAYDTGLTPLMGFHALLMGVVAAVIGGVGSIPGALLGSMLIACARNLGVLGFPSQWQEAIVFLILILFLLFRPQGFLGKPLRKAAV